jgi:metal-responsive CopG/Arc/MetJ family transcriptional regulator
MQITIEIDDKVLSKVDSFATNRIEYFQNAIQEKVLRDEKDDSNYEEKLKRTIESYQKFPQQPEEYDIWLDEQVWEE